ncbi:MAG: type III pantothenate kinase [Bacteroidales bacterium]|nr:type III pantothenate kinase [Bacteroidales bacterium]
MDLVVDAGNTSLKCFVFEGKNIVDSLCMSYESFFSKEQNTSLLKKEYEKAIFCNVSKYDTEQIIQGFYVRKKLEFTRKTKLPIKIAYKTPETLGYDRIAAAVGAESLCPLETKLIIDFGTAITIDVVDENASFVGGNISLGLKTRFRALHEFTGSLPLMDVTDEFDLLGNNTQTAIQNGVINGITFEIEEYIRVYSAKYQDIKVFFTGGDCLFFEKRVKNDIFANPKLVALGLHSILEYNEI